jgi:hypothetical protein
MQSSIKYRACGAMTILLLGFSLLVPGRIALAQQADNSNPPEQTTKLIFIHHSTGENWLRDDYGGLGLALSANNYYVSDTNYGWGPNSIGDRTDIPDWLEWFSSDQTSMQMDAVFTESSQNSSYSRLLDDPGGENEIILFKSCFPNSALEGSIGDLPSSDGWLTIGHAKYVYNQILKYFATRPDKLFIVITAPPLSDPTYAENARAFNQWLFNDWLDENDYTLPNVAVFDFYNVLTSNDAHHRFTNGIIEHTYTSNNTLFYPSGDDHPSEAGSRKATEEFLPLLNIFYHRWQADNASAAPVETPAGSPALHAENPVQAAPPESVGDGVPLPPEIVLTIDDFEAGSTGWTAYWDEATSTSVSCETEAGSGNNGSESLRIDFSVDPGSWATCAIFFETPQDWSVGEWMAYDIYSENEFQPFNLLVYGGTPENRETYIQKRETPAMYLESYNPFTTMWTELLRADWEGKPVSFIDHTGQVTGLAFGFDAGPDVPYTGSLWVDNIRLEKSPTYPETGFPPKNGLPCLGSILFPLFLIGATWVFKRN